MFFVLISSNTDTLQLQISEHLCSKPLIFLSNLIGSLYFTPSPSMNSLLETPIEPSDKVSEI